MKYLFTVAWGTILRSKIIRSHKVETKGMPKGRCNLSIAERPLSLTACAS